ncbi:MAG: uroporphyrinogen-III synthase, partial [Pseudomonadota bacterium]
VPVPSPEAEALVFTSANAVAAAASQDWALPPLPVYAVGARTAAAARAAGHDTVIDGGGEAASLLDVLTAAPERTFCHLRGHHVARDLAAPLAAAGKRLMALTVYDAVAVPLYPRPMGALAEGRARTIGLWSPRAAALFAEILAAHPDWPRHPLTAVTISARAAAALTGLRLHDVRVAEVP